MTKHSEHLLRGLRALTLSDAAYARIRSSLVSYADMHAVVDGVISAYPAAVVSGWFRNPKFIYSFALALLVLTGGSGASAAAEKAVPGDVLYSLKTEVNEKVAASFANTPEEIARHSGRLAERRIDEAVLLAADGKLDAATAAYIEEEVTLHLASSDTATDLLESTGEVATALAVRAEIEETISAQTHLLLAVTGGAQAATLETEGVASAETILATSLDEKIRVLSESRLKTEIAVLPGLGSVEGGIDFGLLRASDASTAKAVTAEAIANAATLTGDQESIHMAVKVVATTSDDTVKKEKPLPVEFLLAPSSLHTDSTESLWFKSRRY